MFDQWQDSTLDVNGTLSCELAGELYLAEDCSARLACVSLPLSRHPSRRCAVCETQLQLLG